MQTKAAELQMNRKKLSRNLPDFSLAPQTAPHVAPFNEN